MVCKGILRGFELVSGLNVNLCKSNLKSLNIDVVITQGAATFLCCESGLIPFSFLGLQVGANHWRNGVEIGDQQYEKQVFNVEREILSIGGRVTLINSILNSIPIYLSFFKFSKVVLKELIVIQREFLWNSGLD